MKMTLRRRLLTAATLSQQGRLPTGFREVEWLQGSGTQYCQTDVQPIYTNTNYTSIKGDITLLDKAQGQFELSSIWWQNYSGASSEFRYGIRYEYKQTNPETYKGRLSYYYGLLNAANGYVDFTNSVFPIDVHYEINKNNIIVNQNTIAKSSNVQYNPATPKPLLIGAYYTGYSADPIAVFNKQTKVKSLFIYNNDTLLYEFVPCYRKSDNKTGFMKITVADGSTVFFPNLGTDEWILGPVV